MQREWDSVLLAAWKRDDKSIAKATHGFMFTAGLTNDEFNVLKRTPTPQQWRMPVRAFVASGLPALSERLWDGGYTREQLLDWLDATNIRTGLRTRSIFADLRKEQRDLDRVRSVDVHHGHRRSDWGVCKA